MIFNINACLFSNKNYFSSIFVSQIGVFTRSQHWNTDQINLWFHGDRHLRPRCVIGKVPRLRSFNCEYCFSMRTHRSQLCSIEWIKREILRKRWVFLDEAPFPPFFLYLSLTEIVIFYEKIEIFHIIWSNFPHLIFSLSRTAHTKLPLQPICGSNARTRWRANSLPFTVAKRWIRWSFR